MKIRGIIWEDFVNYKKICTTIEMPYCNFKCGSELCQNYQLATAQLFDVDINKIINQYLHNNITEAIVFQGLEPFDSYNDLREFINLLRIEYKCDDDIVIYTGYNKNEIMPQIKQLSQYKNIIVKFGRYIPNQTSHKDNILGVMLASDNQYAEKL